MVIPSGIGFIFRSRQGLPPKSAGVLIVRVLCFLPGLAFLGHLQYEVHFDQGFHTQSTKMHLKNENYYYDLALNLMYYMPTDNFPLKQDFEKKSLK